MTELSSSSPLTATSASLVPNSSMRRALPVLLAAVFLERFCGMALHSVLGQQLLAPFNYTLSTTQALLTGFSGFSTLLLLPAGWLADRYWGVRRTLLIGAVLLLLSYLALAALFSSGWAASTSDSQVYLIGLLALLALSSSFLGPGLLVAVGTLQSSYSRLLRNFLLLRLVSGLAGVVQPLLFGAMGHEYGLVALLLLVSTLAAGLVGLLLIWRQAIPPMSPPLAGETLRSPAWWLAVMAVVVVSVRVALLVFGARAFLPWASAGLFLGGLLYLEGLVRTSAEPAAKAVWPLMLGVFGLHIVFNLAVGMGYGVPVEPFQLMLWGLIPWGVLLLLLLWVRRYAETIAQSRLLQSMLTIAGAGTVLLLGMVALQLGPAFDGNSSGTLLGLPPALLLHIGLISLLFLLPVVISRQAPMATRTRFMALVLMLGAVASGIADALLDRFW